MTDRVIVSGYSDDIILVQGDLEAEIRPSTQADDEGVWIGLSCGVLLHVRYDGDWTIRLETDAPGDVYAMIETAHSHAVEGVREYSDAAIVEADSIEWATLAESATTTDGGGEA